MKRSIFFLAATLTGLSAVEANQFPVLCLSSDASSVVEITCTPDRPCICPPGFSPFNLAPPERPTAAPENATPG